MILPDRNANKFLGYIFMWRRHGQKQSTCVSILETYALLSQPDNTHFMPELYSVYVKINLMASILPKMFQEQNMLKRV